MTKLELKSICLNGGDHSVFMLSMADSHKDAVTNLVQSLAAIDGGSAVKAIVNFGTGSGVECKLYFAGFSKETIAYSLSRRDESSYSAKSFSDERFKTIDDPRIRNILDELYNLPRPGQGAGYSCVFEALQS